MTARWKVTLAVLAVIALWGILGLGIRAATRTPQATIRQVLEAGDACIRECPEPFFKAHEQCSRLVSSELQCVFQATARACPRIAARVLEGTP